MLSSVSARLVRPAVKVAQRASSPTRARMSSTAPRATLSDGNRLERQRQDNGRRGLSYPARYAVAPRPFRLSTDFFPDQVGSIFRDIEDEIARLWGDDASSSPQLASKTLGAVDIKETQSSFVFTLDTPGLTKQDISVRITPENVLVVSGERNKEEKREEDGFHRYERAFGKFQRRFVLPEHVDVQGIKAEVNNGELAVTVPKKEKEGRQLTEIPVEDSTPASQEENEEKIAEAHQKPVHQEA